MKTVIRTAETHPLTWRLRDDKQPVWLDEYRSKNGYEGARKALTGMAPDEIVTAVKDAGLKGRGGAGFSTDVYKRQVLAKGESIPLILLEEPSPFRQNIIAALETARVSWHLSHGASSLSGVKAAVKAGLGVTARPVEMMSPDLRVAGISEGLPALPDTRYVVSCNPRTVSELPQAIFQSLSQETVSYTHLERRGGYR